MSASWSTEHEMLASWRNDTPGTRNLIHLNNAGASLMPLPVRQAIDDYLDLEMQMGGYEAAEASTSKVDDFYRSLAQLFGVDAKNFAFTSNATDAYSRALSSIPLQKGDIILTTSNDYASNFLTFLAHRKRLGIDFHLIGNTGSGEVDLDSLDDLIKKYAPKIVAITQIPTNSGLIQPVVEIGRICQKYDLIYIVDGCQAGGQLDVNIDEIQCDFYSGSFRKFLRGPRGCGFLYVSDRMLSQQYYPMILDMSGATWTGKYDFELQPTARRYETFEMPYALIMGARASVRYALDVGMAIIEDRVKYLGSQLRNKWREAPGDILVLDRGKKQGAIVTIHIPNTDPNLLKKYLQSCHINCSISIRSSALLDFDEKQVEWALRFSPHYYNTIEELDSTVTAVIDYTKAIA